MRTPSIQPVSVAADTESADGPAFEHTGRRVAGELAAALKEIPSEQRSIRAVASYLGVDASVCQKWIAAAQSGNDPLLALERSPGVAGLRSIAKALRRKRVRPEVVRALEGAIEQFASLIDRSGRSHANLQRRIAGMRDQGGHEAAPADKAESEALRRRMYQLTAAWIGFRVDTHATITIARAVPEAGDQIEGAKVSAFVGHRSRNATMPLVLSTRYRSGEIKRKPEEQPHAPGKIVPPELQAELMTELSSSAAGLISTHSDEHGQVQVIDRASLGGAPSNTVVFARMPRVRHPRFCNVPLFTVIVPVEHPCVDLVSDIWLDRSLMDGVPEAHLAWYGEPLRSGQGVPWYHRLPESVGVELLSPRLLKSTEAWPQQTEATLLAFERLGFSIQSFMGFRIHIKYPVWGSATATVFNYADRREGHAPVS